MAMVLSAAALPGQRHPRTYAGATLAQWLDKDFAVAADDLPARFARPDREAALRAFGIELPARPFLHRVLREDGFLPNRVSTVLVALSAAEDTEEFAPDLWARWQRHPWDVTTVRTLLAVDPGAWVGVSPVLREQVERVSKGREPRRALRQGIVRAVPTTAALDPEWRELLQGLVTAVEDLPPLKSLPPAVREPAVLVPALRSRGWTSLPLAGWGWIGFVAEHPSSIALAIPHLREEVQAVVERHAKAVQGWRVFPDTFPPGLDLRPARLLGAAGPGQLPFLQGLLDEEEIDLRHQGYVGIGQMARLHETARAVLMEQLGVVAELPVPGTAVRRREITPLPRAPHLWRDRACFVDACVTAGPSMVAPLLESLDPMAPGESCLALEALRCLWVPPAIDAPRASPQLAPVLALLDADDAALREVALACAVGCARYEPIDAADLAALADDLAKATEPTPRLRVRLWQCWRDHGAWLQDRAASCTPPVRHVLLSIARTSPTARRRARPARIDPDWRQCVRDIAELADELPADHRLLRQLAHVGNDLFVMRCASAALRDLAK